MSEDEDSFRLRYEDLSTQVDALAAEEHRGRYKHAEAYCLMTYRSDDGTEQEVIWNSRDGVTPFVISLRSGKTATHVNWRSDRCVPDYKPQPGERVFVDLTGERARECAQEQLSRLTLSAFDSKAPSVTQLAREYMRHPGAPDLIEAEEYLAST